MDILFFIGSYDRRNLIFSYIDLMLFVGESFQLMEKYCFLSYLKYKNMLYWTQWVRLLEAKGLINLRSQLVLGTMCKWHFCGPLGGCPQHLISSTAIIILLQCLSKMLKNKDYVNQPAILTVALSYSRLDENELSMMVDQGAVDQLLVDQETEESFRRDHRTTSSTTTSGP